MYCLVVVRRGAHVLFVLLPLSFLCCVFRFVCPRVLCLTLSVSLGCLWVNHSYLPLSVLSNVYFQQYFNYIAQVIFTGG